MRVKIKLVALYIAYLLVAVLGGMISVHFQGVAQKTYLGSYAILSVGALMVAAALLTMAIIFRTLLNTCTREKETIILNVIFTIISAALLVCSYVFAIPLYVNLSLSPDYLPLAMIVLLTSDVFNLVAQLRRKNRRNSK